MSALLLDDHRPSLGKGDFPMMHRDNMSCGWASQAQSNQHALGPDR